MVNPTGGSRLAGGRLLQGAREARLGAGTSFEELVDLMVDADLKRLETHHGSVALAS